MKELICYLDINEIEYKKTLLEIAENIDGDSKLLIYTHKWEILKYYQAFLNNKISAEDFFMIWDISSHTKLKSKTLILESLFRIYKDFGLQNIEKYKDVILVIDKKSKINFEHKCPDKLWSLIWDIELLGSKMFFI